MLHSVATFFSLMLQGIRGLAAGVLSLPFVVKFVLFWFIGFLFLMFNAPSIYGAAASQQTTILLLYGVSVLMALFITRKRNPLLTLSTAEFVITFVVSAVLFTGILKWIVPTTPSPAELTTASVGILLTHALIVAIGEETIFRFAIPSFIPGPPIVAQAISAIIFGALHYTAYNGDPLSMAFAAGLGFVFGTIVVMFPRVGLVIAYAAHASWNWLSLGFT